MAVLTMLLDSYILVNYYFLFMHCLSASLIMLLFFFSTILTSSDADPITGLSVCIIDCFPAFSRQSYV